MVNFAASRFPFPMVLALALAGTTACKSAAPEAAVKDATLSPSDVKKELIVVWLDASDKSVHAGNCPANAAVVNRGCQNRTEKLKPLDHAEYKTRLKAAIIASRPGAKPLRPGDDDPDRIASIERKIKRLGDKISAGGLSQDEQANFTQQLTQLNAELARVKVVLSGAEQKEMDAVLASIEAGKDVTYDQGERLYSLALAPFGMGRLLPPPAGTKDNPLDVEAVLAYWNEEAEMFYGSGKRAYTQGTGVDILNEPISSCISACPPYYSTLVCHFYCWHPSYQAVSPNIRGCFTEIARGSFSVQKNGQQIFNYPEMFDYCMYQDFDPLEVRQGKAVPAYDQKVIDANKAADKGVGVLKYMTPKQAEIFQYVMYTWYNPFAFDVKDQQKVLDEFYKAHANLMTAPQATTSGKANHPSWNAIMGYMQDWDKDHGR